MQDTYDAGTGGEGELLCETAHVCPHPAGSQQAGRGRTTESRNLLGGFLSFPLIETTLVTAGVP